MISRDTFLSFTLTPKVVHPPRLSSLTFSPDLPRLRYCMRFLSLAKIHGTGWQSRDSASRDYSAGDKVRHQQRLIPGSVFPVGFNVLKSDTDASPQPIIRISGNGKLVQEHGNDRRAIAFFQHIEELAGILVVR